MAERARRGGGPVTAPLAATAFLAAVVLACVLAADGAGAALIVLAGIWVTEGVTVTVLICLARRAGLNYEEHHQ